MASALYLEHYLDSLQHLPIELQRNFKLMRDLDNRAHGLMRSIDLMAGELLPNVPKMNEETKKKKVNNIQGLFNKAKEYGDDKVQLAIQTYELVDKHIRRLDADLARFEAEIQEKAQNAARRRNSCKKTDIKALLKKGRKKNSGNDNPVASTSKSNPIEVSSDDEAPAGRSVTKKKGKGKGASSAHKFAQEDEDSAGLSEAGKAHPTDVLDMPVDPNEPTYCLCNQVSYGEMIGCDNQDCPIEWFHFACVDLKIKPKGKWYCPKCAQDRKKK